jgi:hypothetical protein
LAAPLLVVGYAVGAVARHLGVAIVPALRALLALVRERWARFPRSAAASVWSAKRLLHSGVSHGATAPLVAIASRRAFEEHAATWTGSEKTAVVLFDGISNPATLEEWAAAQPIGSGCGLSHQRWVGRYQDGSPLVHGCGNGACYCSDPERAVDWEKDTVVLGSTYPPSPYVCDDFTPEAGEILYRFVSCGAASAAGACSFSGDIIPDAQQLLPFQALDACPGVTATYASYPSCTHVQCGGWDACGGRDAVQWLEQNGW